MIFRRLRQKKLACVVVTCAAAAVWSGPATAAAAPPPTALSREQVNPAQQAAASRRQRPVDMFTDPGREACQLSDDPQLGFILKQAIIRDEAGILSDRDKQAAVEDMVGRRITPRDLCEIRDRLAARIFRRGVLARVNIPTQTIANGSVTFHVFAARIAAVRIEGDDIGPAQVKIEAYLSHLRRQNVFDLDRVQKWLLIANDIPGVQAVATVVHSTAPGAAPGSLDLVVTLKRTPVDEIVLVSNANAKTLGEELMSDGFRLISGGTDNHLILIDMGSKGLTGKIAEAALGRAGITVNKNLIPFDPRKPMDPSGIRMGTPALTSRGMKEDAIRQVATWIKTVLNAPEDATVADRVKHEIKAFAQDYPVPADAVHVAV